MCKEMIKLLLRYSLSFSVTLFLLFTFILYAESGFVSVNMKIPALCALLFGILAAISFACGYFAGYHNKRKEN